MTSDAGYGISGFKTELMYELNQVVILQQGFGSTAMCFDRILLTWRQL
jgi:hypothetical protein